MIHVKIQKSIFGISISPLFSNQISKQISSVSQIIYWLSFEVSIMLLRSLCICRWFPENHSRFFKWIIPGFFLEWDDSKRAGHDTSVKECKNVLCVIKKPQDDKDLRSRWIHYKNPYLRLGPFKLEEKNLVPFVGIFRDFLSERNCDTFINSAKGKLHRSNHSGKSVFAENVAGQTWV